MENKKKAAAVAVVKAIIEQEVYDNDIKHQENISEPSAWTQWGKQMIMANRNNIQMKLNRRR